MGAEPGPILTPCASPGASTRSPALQRVPWRFNPSTYANARAQVITMGQIQSPLAEDRIKFSRPVAEARYHSCRLIVGILQERKGGERFVHQEVGGSPCEYISVI